MPTLKLWEPALSLVTKTDNKYVQMFTEVLRNKVLSTIDLKTTTATWSNVRLAAILQASNKWEYTMAFTPLQISIRVTVASGMIKLTTVIPGDITETLKG